MEQPMLEVWELRKYFDHSQGWLRRAFSRQPKKMVKAVDGVSFAIDHGRTLGLVGESGCGKTTIARMIAGLYKPTSGDIIFSSDAEDSQDSCRIQMIFQDPYSSMNPRWRIRDIVAEPIRESNERTDKQALKNRVSELLLQVGLSPDDADKYPHQFSGGQRQRISIARALSVNPDLLVCDEPTSALDVSVQAQILNLLKEIQRNYNLTCLFISHNLAVVHHVSDQVGVMYLGKLCEITDNNTLFHKAKHPYTRMLLEAIPDLETNELESNRLTGDIPDPLNPPTGCVFHPRCPEADSRCKTEIPGLRLIGNTLVACHHPIQDRN